MGNVPKHIEEAFYRGRRSDEVPFVINDSVDVVAGPYGGRGGAVISIAAMLPELMLLVELGDTGEDAVVPAIAVRLDESAE